MRRLAESKARNVWFVTLAFVGAASASSGCDGVQEMAAGGSVRMPHEEPQNLDAALVRDAHPDAARDQPRLSLDANSPAPSVGKKASDSDFGTGALDTDAGSGDSGTAALDTDAGSGDSGTAALDTDAGSGDSGKRAPDQERLPALADQRSPSMINGIALDEDNYLWVTDGTGSQLLRLELPGEKIVARYGRAQGISGPDDLVVEDDAVYWTANWDFSGNVGRLDRRTGRSSVIANTGLGTNPIARLPSGDLLVGRASFGALFNFTGLFAVAPEGEVAPRRVVADSRGINAFCIGPDGFVYGPTQTSVVKIDLTSGKVTTLRDGFGSLAAVRCHPADGQLYVLDAAPADHPTTPVLVQMAPDGSDVRVFAQLTEQPDAQGPAADNFVIAPDGTFYVTRFQEPVITRVSPGAAEIRDFVVGQP